ncbi:MAG TPA: hypothetical protein VLT36_22495 [Candidatus Dormibacteraeota bacterium]|nr:hypothetical protein [Candidatus Dormibacteraeota bacterium]
MKLLVVLGAVAVLLAGLLSVVDNNPELLSSLASTAPAAVTQEREPQPKCEPQPGVTNNAQVASGPASAPLPVQTAVVTLSPPPPAQIPFNDFAAQISADPSAAAKFVMQLPEGPTRIAAAEIVAISWASNDLPSAIQWIGTLPDGDLKQTVTRTTAYEAARIDPLSALDLASMLPASAERTQLLAHTLSQWATSEPAAATDWVNDLPDDSLKQRLLESVAVSAAEQNPEAAAALVASAITSDHEQSRAAVAVIQRWAQTAPEKAAQWLQDFPEGETRRAGTENLLAIWKLSDPQAATQWEMRSSAQPENSHS